MRSRRRNAQLGAQGAEGAGGDGGEGEPLAVEDGDPHEGEQEQGEGSQRAPAPERENVQPAPGLELIGQEMVVKPPGSGKGSAATRARPAGIESGGDGAGREVAGEQGPGTPSSSMVQRRLWSTASRNPWATPGAVELQPGGDQDLRGPAGQPESYGPLFTQEQLEYLKRWDRPGGLVNLGEMRDPPLRRPDFLPREQPQLLDAGAGDGQLQRPREVDSMRSEIKRLMEENKRLKAGNNSGETYTTPDPPNGKVEEDDKRESSEEMIRDDEKGDHLAIILKLMEGMQQIQKKLLAGGSRSTEEESVEVVKAGTVELPMLAELNAETSSIDLQDWLTLITPAMSDLSETSQEWWELVLQEAKRWYGDYMQETPLKRLTMVPKVGESQSSRWRRVERKAVTLLIKAVPDAVKDEVVATKSLNAFSLVCRLMMMYQPGGIAERAGILRNLEQPGEATNIQAAVTGIRRWLRWKRRAEEIGVSLPDPSVLNRGLHRLTRKVLEGNRDLNFKINLAKSQLQVDTVPTYATIGVYCEHLLSELEQLVHTEKKSASGEIKAKKIEGTYAEDKGGKEDFVKEKKPCRFFLTDQGCRRGAQCTFSHEARDGRPRCYVCGATSHFAKDCSRKIAPEQAGKKDFKPGAPKVAKVETENAMSSTCEKGEAQKSLGGQEEVSPKGAKGEADALQSVLEEAGKMLRSLTVAPTGKIGRDAKLEDLQKQLNEMKIRKFEEVKISKIDFRTEMGLLDSGATHAMRGMREGDDRSDLETIVVELAGGQRKELLMTPGKVIIHEEAGVQPIVPLGLLVDKLNCEVTWTSWGACQMKHPTLGEIPVRMNAGCPEVDRDLALCFIDMLEQVEVAGGARLRSSLATLRGERGVMEALARRERVFDGVPAGVMANVVSEPASDLKGIPLNRRRRKRMQRGFVLHLYAGEKEGYTLQRALKEVGGDTTRLVEIDLKRGDNHDMLTGPLYPSLLRAALDGYILGVVGGPNCRTRSVLRHYPLPAGRPRPVRGVEPENWFGFPWLDEEEKKQVFEDDVLLYRMVMLYCVAEEARRGRKVTTTARSKVAFLLEQPEAPWYVPECGSWWRTRNYVAFRDQHGLLEHGFKQGDYGGLAVKPTRIVTDLEVDLPPGGSSSATTREMAAVADSAALSRWAPGFMREVARSLQQEVFGRPAHVKKLSWFEHVRHGHVPFRRDCRVCQEASARGKRHAKIAYPYAAVLNADLSGPYRAGKDVGDATQKYFLIGSFTWPAEEDQTKFFDGKEQEEDGEDLPVLEEKKAEGEDPACEKGDLDDPEGDPEKEGEMVDGDGQEEDPEDRARKECGEPKPLRLIVKAISLPDKKAKTVLQGLQDIYIQLKREGYPVQRLHTDRGKEFLNHDLKKWCLVREIEKTTTSADSPQESGRAEACVGSLKSRMRRLLKGAKMDVKFWPMAARYAVVAEEKRQRNELMPAAFGEEVWVPRRSWKRTQDPFGPTYEKARYLAVVKEVTSGHGILREDGKIEVVSRIVRGVVEPEDRLLPEQAEPHHPRRRIRGDQPRWEKKRTGSWATSARFGR